MMLRSSELTGMSEMERAQTFRALAAALGKPNPDLDREIRQRIRAFEVRYEASTGRMLEELRAGERKETAEIAEWLFWARVLNGDVAG